ncbi:dicarboxylate transporter/tellurite-resistance protein TehA [Moraxella nasovis]|uniref:dicarboxylate transporter/tellurite-resistance protein TehA n=1 Tax=Moraxella nasovis TaxID=2904121 RepID=UPI001F619DF8|nr:dicarboxylate transporter/tellurite-resistance protein TehA [Moraxella nasovis]UNU72795.1 dicarboxylate transporter/tellurite-resistance protein TehA [Moraxella nasovis]
MTNMNERKFPIPTSYLGISLGLGASTLAWRHAQVFFDGYAQISLVLGVMASVVWLLHIIAFIIKMIRYPNQLSDEWQHPIQFSFLSMIPITTIIMGDIWYAWYRPVGELLMILGIVGQLAFVFWRVAPLWKGNFCQESVMPPFYLPFVAANFSSAGAMALLGFTDVAYLFFGAGMIAWVIIEPIILQNLRSYTHNQALRPTLGIVLAPAFVGSMAYLSINHGQVDTFAKILWGYGLLQALILLRLLPWIAEKGFVIGLWSFSFGLASMMGTAGILYQHSQLGVVAHTAFWVANAGVCLLIVGTLVRLVQGRFTVK